VALNKEQLAELLFEVHDSNSLVTGGAMSGAYCPAQCKFCYLHGEGPHYTSKLPYVGLDDVQYAIPFIRINRDDNPYVMLGDSALRLSAELFAHPDAIDIIKLVRNGIPLWMPIGTFTSGNLVTREHFDHILKIDNFHLIVTIGSMHKSYREQMFPKRFADPSWIAFMWKEYPSISATLYTAGGLEQIKRDIGLLTHLREKQHDELILHGGRFTVRAIEATAYHSPYVKRLSEQCWKDYERVMEYVLETVPDVYLDPCSPEMGYRVGYKRTIDECESYKEKIKDFVRDNPGPIFFPASERAYSFWKKYIDEEHMNNVTVLCAKNSTLGAHCAGLLTFKDLEQNLTGYDTRGTTILIPTIMINRTLLDIMGVSMYTFARNMKARVEPL